MSLKRVVAISGCEAMVFNPNMDIRELLSDQQRIAKTEAKQLIREVFDLNSLAEQGQVVFTVELISGYMERFDVLLRSPLDKKYRNHCSKVYNELALCLNRLSPEYFLRNNDEMISDSHLVPDTRDLIMLGTDEGIGL